MPFPSCVFEPSGATHTRRLVLFCGWGDADASLQLLRQSPPMRTVGQGLGNRVPVAYEPLECLVIVDDPGRLARQLHQGGKYEPPSGLEVMLPAFSVVPRHRSASATGNHRN